MPKKDYDRYELLRNNDGSLKMMPFVEIPENSSDKYENFILGRTRLDRLSNKYYKNPFYDFLILYANPDYTSEFSIPDNTIIRIPFPLDKAKKDYEDGLNRILNK